MSHLFELAFFPDKLLINNPDEKRALSYALTIQNLVKAIVDEQLPADKVLANYFRSHKKHGSKDRRIIRESLFGLFRWWGWLAKISISDTEQPLAAQLAMVAILENHTWLPISQAWLKFAGIDMAFDVKNNTPQQCFEHIFPAINISLAELVPTWFWQECQASDNQKLASSFCTRPPIWARLQNIATPDALELLNNENIPAKASGYFDDAIELGSKSVNLPMVNLYQEGKLEIQDLASQVIGQMCQVQSDQIWWDACAGAGGKSLQLASLMAQSGKHEGKIIASDIRISALKELQKRADRAGFSNICMESWQESLPVANQSCDGVLVDAPCSCSGTWRRNPDLRWFLTRDDIKHHAKLQLDILNRACAAVKIGGVLLYATCSIFEQENSALVNDFLALHPEFELIPMTHPFTGKQQMLMTIWPYEANSDGMFVAKMQRIK